MAGAVTSRDRPLPWNPLDVRGLRADKRVQRLVRAWRELTGGTSRRIEDRARRTLVACSGGADSSALAIALASATDELAIAHVVHDLRPRHDALADREAAKDLAQRLGRPFVEAEIRVAGVRGNDEANARRERYRVLADLARRSSCSYVAAAHHADDEAETVLMGLLRGAGPRGLGGIPRSRRIGQATLVRPMLELTRADAEAICRAAGWAWREDETNRDTTRLRASIRHTLGPAIEALRPGAARRIARTAALLRDAAGLVEDRSAQVWAAGSVCEDHALWARPMLRQEREIVLGSLLRRACRHLHGGRRLDRMGRRRLAPVTRAIRDERTDPRRFVLSGLEVLVDAGTVRVERRNDDA